LLIDDFYDFYETVLNIEEFGFGSYLGFGAWDLEFQLCALRVLCGVPRGRILLAAVARG
jgi:hypothetical protein